MLTTFGCDPELLLVSDDGHPRSAITHLGASKDAPLVFGGATMYHDNVLVEFTVPPGRSADEVERNIRFALRSGTNAVKPLRLEARASVTFPAGEMNHPDSFRFGCNPEYSAWRLVGGEPVACEAPEVEGGFRTCGGHIHIGADIARSELPAFVRVLDLFVGIPSLLMDHDPTSAARHRLYGGAGKFRPTRYGVEYRTLSNFWLADPRLVRAIFYLTFWATQDNGAYVPADVLTAVDKHDREMARHIYRMHVQPRIGMGISDLVDRTMDIESRDIYTNWLL